MSTISEGRALEKRVSNSLSLTAALGWNSWVGRLSIVYDYLEATAEYCQK